MANELTPQQLEAVQEYIVSGDILAATLDKHILPLCEVLHQDEDAFLGLRNIMAGFALSIRFLEENYSDSLPKAPEEITQPT